MNWAESKVTLHSKNLMQIYENGGFYIPKRFIVMFLGFFGLFNVYALRVNLSVVMVAMVNSTDDTTTNQSATAVECPMLVEPKGNTSKVEFKGEQYDWDSKTQAIILGSFFYGLIMTQIPGGFFAEKFGAKWVFGGGIFLTSVLTLLSPLAARSGTAVFMVVRILEGLAEGVALPVMNFIISRWSPLLERSRVSTIIFMGAQFGNVIALPICGWLSSTDLLGGWPSAFYIFGTFGCIWFIAWAFLVYESPETHPSISHTERASFQASGNLTGKRLATPWKAIFTSMPVWATLVCHFLDNFGFCLYFTELPNYLSSILHFNIKEDGVLSALPFIMQAILACVASYIADKLRSSGRLNITTIRKIFNTIGMMGMAICLLLVTACGCQPLIIVGLLTLGMALNGIRYSGFHVTHMDMSPDFSGTLYGITNSAANLNGIIAPAIVGAITANGVTIHNWNKVFYITSAAYVSGAIFYLIFASAEKQPWGDAYKSNSNKILDSEKKIASEKSTYT